ncbi:MAG TPA: hypothetical protein VNG33_22545 [Polyangiaceae bacterium]|nr:hypothetical protein [Polyangiaceae bacterium]
MTMSIRISQMLKSLCIFSVLTTASGLVACGSGVPAPSPEDGKCTLDTQCKGDRVCVNSECVAPPQAAGGSSTTGGSSTAGGSAGSPNVPSSGGVAGTGGSANPPAEGGSPDVTPVTPTPTPAPMCTAKGASCETNGQCCGFDATSPDALCLNVQGAGQCAGTCHSSGECSTGCCAAVKGTDAFGVCGPASACTAPTTTDTTTCLKGAAIFCACAGAADSPCTDSDRQSLAQNCANGDPQGAFTCLGKRAEPTSLDACVTALNACAPN